MKKIILSAAAVTVLAFAGSTVKASTLNRTSDTTQTTQDSLAKTAVNLEEIPAAVKTALKSEKVKEWTPSAAFLVKTSAGAEYYHIDLTKGQEKAVLRLDKDGKSVN